MSVFSFIFGYLKKTKVMVGIILFSLVIRSLADRGEVYTVSQTIGALPQYASDKSILNNIIFYICLLAFFLFLDPIIHVIGYLSIYIQATRILIDGFYRFNSFVSYGLSKYNRFLDNCFFLFEY